MGASALGGIYRQASPAQPRPGLLGPKPSIVVRHQIGDDVAPSSAAHAVGVSASALPSAETVVWKEEE